MVLYINMIFSYANCYYVYIVLNKAFEFKDLQKDLIVIV
jgi:hypothetical protein